MRKFKRLLSMGLSVLALLKTSSALASVSLAIAATPTDFTTRQFTVNQGGSFSLTFMLISTSTVSTDQVTGLDFQVQAGGPQAGVFALTGRTLGNTQLTDVQTADATLLDPSTATLNPANGSSGIPSADGDLGLTISTSTASSTTATANAVIKNNYGNGTVAGGFAPANLMTLTFSVAPNATAGNYTISPVVSDPFGALGYTYYAGNVNNRPTFGQGTFATVPNGAPINDTFTIKVQLSPEPTTAALMGVVGIGLLSRRRRQS